MLPLNRYIDHTLLKPYIMDAAFESHLEEAIKYNFYSVCVSPHVAPAIVKALAPYPETKVCTVVSFPHGNLPLALKAKEVDYFIQAGIHEIDWVLNYAEVLNDNWDLVAEEMRTIASLCRQASVVSKCIVETGILKRQDWQARLLKEVAYANVDFIKTSTGFTGSGASLETIQLWDKLRSGTHPKIKASGGIKSAEQALAFINAGADRLGLSASVEVMDQYAMVQKDLTGGTEKTSILVK